MVFNRDQQELSTPLENLPAEDVKPLIGKSKGLYRLRIGNLRIIFEKIDDNYLIHDVRFRGDAYR